MIRTVPDPPKYDPSRPIPPFELAYQYKLPNCPGKSCIGLIVNFPPNATIPPHRHARASVAVLVLEASVVNKMNDEPTQVIDKGEGWFEAPGCHHKVSENYSTTETATLLGTFIVDTAVVEKNGIEGLIELDEEFKDLKI